MNTDLVSVIVPIYNAVDQLEQCVKSIENQTYETIEIILVDDGSTDGSTELCERLANENEHIVLIKKDNQGVSLARNDGILRAKGTYIQFVDSDDTLDQRATELLVNEALRTNADLVIGGFKSMKDQRIRCPQQATFESRTAFIEHITEYYVKDQNTLNVPWNKLYRKSLMTTLFDEHISKGEDLLFNLAYIRGAETIASIAEVIYYYNNVNDSSLASRFRDNGFLIEEMLHNSICGFCHEYFPQEEFSGLYINYLDAIKGQLISLYQRSGKSNKEKKNVVKQVLRMDSVKDLTKKNINWSKKDSFLIFLFKHHLVSILSLYYQRRSYQY